LTAKVALARAAVFIQRLLPSISIPASGRSGNKHARALLTIAKPIHEFPRQVDAAAP
jgi:hypothetical protein